MRSYLRMKTLCESLHLARLASVLITISCLVTACGGGGGGAGHPPGGGGVGWVPGGGVPDPGVSPGGGVEPAMQPVRCEGRVVFRDARDRLQGLAGIKVIARNPSGAITSSDITGADGRYSLSLDTDMVNNITANRRGYTFSPTEIPMRPRGPENISDIEGTRITINVPGVNANVPDPVGVGGAVVGVPGIAGTISGSILEVRRENGREVTVPNSVLRAKIVVFDASGNNQLAAVQTDGNNRFSYTGRVGTKVVLKPRPLQDIAWRTPSMSATIKRVPSDGPMVFIFIREGIVDLAPAPELRAMVDVFSPSSSGLRGAPDVMVDFINLSGNNIVTRTPTNDRGRASVASRQGERWAIRIAGSSGYQGSPAQVNYTAESNPPRVPRIYLTGLLGAQVQQANRPSLRPAPAAPTPTPRQIFKPIPRPIPAVQATPSKKPPVFFRPRPTPTAP